VWWGELMISAWADELHLQSPDGRFRAVIESAAEIGMGAPTSGTLRVGRLVVQGCNPSAVWSEDSRFLAVPQWAGGAAQRLLVIEPAANRSEYAAGTYSVLELHSFGGGIITGVDSPAYQPLPVRVPFPQSPP
jgi:hypothetical protein